MSVTPAHRKRKAPRIHDCSVARAGRAGNDVFLSAEEFLDLSIRYNLLHRMPPVAVSDKVQDVLAGNSLFSEKPHR